MLVGGTSSKANKPRYTSLCWAHRGIGWRYWDGGCFGRSESTPGVFTDSICCRGERRTYDRYYLSTIRRKLLLTVTYELAKLSFPQLPQDCAEFRTVQPVANGRNGIKYTRIYFRPMNVLPTANPAYFLCFE
jgi:hypothetical protein